MPAVRLVDPWPPEDGAQHGTRHKRVLIIEPQVKQYRQRFYADLAARLRTQDVDLRVAYSDPNPREATKRDMVEFDGGVGVKVKCVWLFNDRVLLQRVWHLVRNADLVIVEQSNKLVLNHVLVAMSQLGLKRVAYWGHGYNRQARRPGASEWFKRQLVRRVDWWFSYTDGVTRYLIAQGMPADRITTVYNTLDTEELRSAVQRETTQSLEQRRAALNIARDARIGLYCGALVPDKRIDFLLDAAERIRRAVPTFELLIIGDGPQRALVETAAAARPYVHHVGAVFGTERSPYFALADVFLLPHLVGLAAVDAFTASVPVVTTRSTLHGPEIEYIEHGCNGCIAGPGVDEFADAVASILGDNERLAAMRVAASATATRLSLSAMVEAFAAGIMDCLAREKCK